MFDMLEPYLAEIKLALMAAAAIGLFWAGWEVNGWRIGVAIEKQKTEAANLLAAETAKVLVAERANAKLTTELEQAHAIHQQAIDSDHERNRRAIAEFGRLRLTGSGPGGNGALSAAARATGFPDGAAAGITIDLATIDLANDADFEARSLLERAAGCATYAKLIEDFRAQHSP
jgi:hypothetical protein